MDFFGFLNPKKEKKEQEIDILESLLSIPEGFDDRAFGSILGAFIGDACGSYLEFINYVASDEEMNTCMEMPGGGPFGCGPG